MKKLLTRLAFLLFPLFPLSRTYANQFIVCASGCEYTTVSNAVAAAGNGDTIRLKGIITEAGITVAKNLTFIGEGMYNTAVQGSATRDTATHRVFYITGGATVTFKDLTVQNGKEGMPDPANAGASGGAFLVDGTSTTLTLINVDVKDNDNGNTSGGAGGAIGLYGTTTNLNLFNCRVEGNTSPGSAGAFYLTATNGVITAKNTVFDNNYAASGSGGAVFLGSTISASFANCTFCYNKANGSSGGAVYGNTAVPEFTNCTFNNNMSTNQGGALRIGPATLTNCTFFQNTATAQGGAIFRGGTNSSNLSIVNCTIYGNTGSAGGGLYYNTTSGAINLVNSVLASNTGGDFYASNSSILSVNEKNYVSANSFGAGSAGFAYESGSLNISSSLVTNGGLTPTLAIGAGSVLINNGISSASGVTVLQKDQRNFSRSGTVDIGAYETAGSEGVTIAYSPLANTTSTATRTLNTTITDGTNGIPLSGSYVPRIYFKKNNGNWLSAAGTLTAGNDNNGSWEFAINNALLGGVANGDVISYFVTAQDNSAGSFAKSNLSGLVAADVLTVSAAPTPESYTINSSTLPIKLVDFAATKQGDNNALLTWKVIEDPDADSYEVLRSTSNSGLKTIATVPAKGLATYAFTDKKVSGTVYYQLKTLTKNGEINYSKVVSVTFVSGSTVQLLPNLVTTGQATLSITAPANTEAMYTIVDAAGREVQKSRLALAAGSNNLVLSMSRISRGQYFLQVSMAGSAPQTIPFVKN
ncbi:MAG TPA: choice-of-anchor Q domain-containing protein [Flavisolibacter sp.]|nr:choice-of-anchor Q domain-containing protein [Flavisolibacter sp.]